MSLVDVLIVGGGPSGLSAALTLVRQKHSVLLFDTSECRAAPSYLLHGHSGSDNQSPADYLKHARGELEAYSSFALSSVNITGLAKINGGFQATDETGTKYMGKKVILASGVVSIFPIIRGYVDCWGKGINHQVQVTDPIRTNFHNLFAQAYQEDTSKVHAGVLAVDWIAMPQFTFYLSHMATQVANSVTIYTHGNEELAATLAPTLEGKPWKTDTRKIAKLALKSSGDTAVEITFEDGSTATEAFIGHSPMATVRGPFAEQLGLKLSQTGGEYEVFGPFNRTSVKGVFAAGDAVTMFKVWPNAVASGAQTASGVAINLQEEKWNLPPIFPSE
ncbi:Uu.00g035830.m01.CDS01 [Anthostomella pinea]|uniref:Uu.00g035830.m01.CDS01 n=1 Tax=Anthostomella pinea TaxID=933095 RepID=A0AAI8YDG8_9PEZI|nr:Uu.00g035830.m01.CDS01 [Anthostomella pinea]